MDGLDAYGGLEEVLSEHEEEFTRYMPFSMIEDFVYEGEQLYDRRTFRRSIRNYIGLFEHVVEGTVNSEFSLKEFIDFITASSKNNRKIKDAISFVEQTYTHNPIVMNHLAERIKWRDGVVISEDASELTRSFRYDQIATIKWEDEAIYSYRYLQQMAFQNKEIFQTNGTITFEELIDYVTLPVRQGAGQSKQSQMIQYIFTEFEHNNAIITYLQKKIAERDSIIVGKKARDLDAKCTYEQVRNIRVDGACVFMNSSVKNILGMFGDVFKTKGGFITIRELIDYTADHAQSPKREKLIQYLRSNFSYNKFIVQYLNSRIADVDSIVVSDRSDELDRLLTYKQVASIDSSFSKNRIKNICSEYGQYFPDRPHVTVRQLIQYALSDTLTSPKKRMISGILNHYAGNVDVVLHLFEQGENRGGEHAFLASVPSLREAKIREQLHVTDFQNPLYIEAERLLSIIPAFDRNTLMHLVETESVDFIARNSTKYISVSSFLHTQELQRSESGFPLVRFYRSMTNQTALPLVDLSMYDAK